MGDGVKVFACFDDVDGCGNSILESPELARGAVAAASADGAAGLEFFNQFFGANPSDPKINKRCQLLKEMRQSNRFQRTTQAIQGRDEATMLCGANGSTPATPPAEIRPGSPSTFTLLMARPEENMLAQVEVAIDVGSPSLDQCRVEINGTPAGCPCKADGGDAGRRLFFTVPGNSFKDGENRLTLSHAAPSPATANSILVKVIPPL